MPVQQSAPEPVENFSFKMLQLKTVEIQGADTVILRFNIGRTAMMKIKVL